MILKRRVALLSLIRGHCEFESRKDKFSKADSSVVSTVQPHMSTHTSSSRERTNESRQLINKMNHFTRPWLHNLRWCFTRFFISTFYPTYDFENYGPVSRRKGLHRESTARWKERSERSCICQLIEDFTDRFFPLTVILVVSVTLD